MRRPASLRLACALAFLASLLITAAQLWGQESPQLAPGQRVRVTAEWQGQHTLIGRLTRWDSDSLWLDVPKRSWNGIGTRPLETVGIPVPLITQIALHRGRTRSTGKSAARGALIGAGAGLVLGLLAVASQNESDWFQIRGEDVAVGALFTGAVGAGIGALVAPHKDLWEPVPLPPSLTGSPEPIAQHSHP